MVEGKLLTPTQVAEHLQIHERTITRWLRDGYLRGFKLSKEWRISAEDLQLFMESQANQPFDQVS